MIMKKRIVLALLCACIILFAGCVSNRSSEKNISPVEAAQQIIKACGRDPESLFASYAAFETEDRIGFAANKYGVEIETGNDIGSYEEGEPSAFEIAVFRFTNNKDAANAAEKLTEYISSVEKAYGEYMPEQAYMAHNSVAVSLGLV